MSKPETPCGLKTLRNLATLWTVPLILLTLLFWTRLAAMFQLWATDPFYSQGFLIPVLALILLWLRCAELSTQPVQPTPAALVLVPFGILPVILLGPMLMTFTPLYLVVTLAALTWTFYGLPILRIAAFPLGLCLLMIPVPGFLRMIIDLPLQRFCANATAAFCRVVGFPVLHNGVEIVISGFTLYIAPQCNGLQSSAALFTASLVYGAVTRARWQFRVLLAILAIPAAYVANLLRLFCDAIFVHYAAGTPWIEYEGYVDLGWGLVVFTVIVVVLLKLLDRAKAARNA